MNRIVFMEISLMLELILVLLTELNGLFQVSDRINEVTNFKRINEFLYYVKISSVLQKENRVVYD